MTSKRFVLTVVRKVNWLPFALQESWRQKKSFSFFNFSENKYAYRRLQPHMTMHAKFQRNRLSRKWVKSEKRKKISVLYILADCAALSRGVYVNPVSDVHVEYKSDLSAAKFKMKLQKQVCWWITWGHRYLTLSMPAYFNSLSIKTLTSF